MAQWHDVEQFVSLSAQVKSGAELHSLMDAITREMGFDQFALVHHVDLSIHKGNFRHFDSGEMIALSSYPSIWIEEFVQRQSAQEDPIWLASRVSAAGFTWESASDMIPFTSGHRQVREDAARAGLADGFTIPAHVPGEASGSCSFAIGHQRPLPVANLVMAQIIGSYAFQAARALAMRQQSYHRRESPTLTTRQRDCVLLAAQGLSDGIIAQRLAISHETVKQHLKDARLRLDAANRTQLVVRAAYCGLIPLEQMVRA